MHPAIRKLSAYTSFTVEEAHALELACSNTLDVPAGTDFAREEEPAANIFFVLSGLACRYKVLPSGRRQIMAFLLPGDSCDVGVSVLERRDHSLLTMSRSVLARSSDLAIEHLSSQYPKIKAAFAWATLVQEAISREWLVNVGARSAEGRAAHLFCELYYRIRALDLADGHGFELPITQQDLADTIGISAVHANRTLQALRRRKLIAFGDKRLTILDLERLEELGEFRRSYLHLDARYHPRLALAATS